MNAMCQTASGLARWCAAPLAFAPPRGLAASLAALGMVATAGLRARRLLEAFRGTPRQRPAGSGGPSEPQDPDSSAYSLWDDPALWMLMMH
jgi:hypothetical protein